MRRRLKRIFSLLLCAAIAITMLPGGMLQTYAADEPCFVTYDGNGASGGSVPSDSGTYADGDTVTVPGNSGTLTRPGFYFGGWMVGDTIYQSSDTFTMGTKNVILYAAWIPVYTVTYDKNDDGWTTLGTPPSDTRQYPQGAAVTVLSDGGVLSSNGYGLNYWNTRKDGSGTRYFHGDTFLMGTGNVTLYAVYKTVPDVVSITYGINYNANGANSGTVPASATDSTPWYLAVSGNTGNLLKTGFQFAGWNTAANGSGTTYQEGDTPYVNTFMTLYALWKPIHTLLYAPNGGSLSYGSDNTDSFPAGSSIQLPECMIDPPNPTDRFIGWNTNTDGSGTTYMPGDVVTLQTNLTLYAIWQNTSGQYGVIYNGNGNDGGALPAISYLSAGGMVTVAAQRTLTRSNYTFLGWSNSGGSFYRPGDTFTMLPNDLVLYAVWQPSYTIAYNVRETSLTVPASTTHVAGGSVTMPGKYGESAYADSDGMNYNVYLIGWSTHSDGSGTTYAPGSDFVLTKDTTMYAVYALSAPVISYTITYSSCGAQGGQAPVDTNTYYTYDNATILNKGSLWRAGCPFTGWQDARGVTFTPGSTIKFPKGLTSLVLFPQFQPNPPNIYRDRVSYDPMGADYGTPPPPFTNPSLEIEFYIAEANTGGLVREGYHFAGWSKQANSSIVEYYPGAHMDAGGASYILYPVWVPGSLTHTVNYSENSRLTSINAKAEAETVTVVSPINTPEGQYFTGWNTQSDGLGTWYMPGDHFAMLTGDVTLYAIYSAAPSNFVTYDGQGLSGICDNVGRSYHTGDTVTTVYPGSLAGPAGTYFAGWNTHRDGSGTLHRPGDSFIIGSSSITLYGIWAVIPKDSYTLTYDANGADSGTPPVQTGTFYAGQSVKLANGSGLSLQKNGHILTGWYVDNVRYPLDSTYVLPYHDVVAEAAWAPFSYPVTCNVTVAYNGNGNKRGTAPPPSGHVLKSSFALPDNTGGLERTGYTFTGWSDGIASYRPGDTYALGRTVDRIKLDAVWQPAYTIAYRADGASGGTAPLDATQYINGQTVTLADNIGGLTLTGALFAGWCIDGQIYPPNETFPMGTASVTATAVWAQQISKDATLRNLKLGSSAVSGFNADDYEYDVTLPTGTAPYSAAAMVSATASHAGTSMRITQASTLPGDATVSVTSQSGTENKTYTIHLTLQSAANTPPNRKSDVSATTTAEVITGGTYSLNLADIFEDADNNPLTCEVSLNNGGYHTVDTAYTYKPSAAGITMLVFRANDGTDTSTDTYSVTLTAADAPTYAVTVTAEGGARSVTVGGTLQMHAAVVPENATSQDVLWSISGGSGASISTSGLLTGTAAGNVTIRATAQDDAGVYGEKEITIINPSPAGTAPTITTTSLPAGTVGTTYSQTLAADGDAPITWSIDSGSLPGGLTLSGDGVISGTPTAATTSNFIMKAVNAAGDDTQALRILITTAPVASYTITATAGSGGSISPSGSVHVLEHDTQVFHIIQDSGYQIASVTVDGVPQGAIPGYTFANVTAGHTISAAFSGIRGNDGGGGIPSIPSPPTYNAEVSTGSGLSSTIPITVDKNRGSASVDINTGSNLISGGNAAVITVPSIPGVTSYSLGIPIAYLKSPSGGMLTFDTDMGGLTLPTDMLAGVAGAEGKNALITIGRGDKTSLSAEAQSAIGNRPLIQLSLALDGVPTEWKNPAAPVTVIIPYTPATEELKSPESIVIWYLDGGAKPICVPDGHYDPASGSVMFTTTHFSRYAVGYNAESFKDVAADAWYGKAVSFIAARGITTGTGNGKFRPDAKLTRGDFIVLLMRSYGIAPDTAPRDNFADAGSTYYTNYLAAAKRLGISIGVGGNMFTPGKDITRQEMFTLLYNVLKVISQLPDSAPGAAHPTLNDFADAGQIASWAKDAMKRLVETGIVAGSSGKLSPTYTATRAEMAQILYNLLTAS